MEVPQALRDLTNQNSIDEMTSMDTKLGCGTPNDLTKESAVDELLHQIAHQCEFYFSDANILKDQFLLKKVKTSKDGWVKLEVVEGFKKMQKLTKNHGIVVKALALSDKLEVSEDGLSVRRRNPLPEWDPTVYYRTLIISELPSVDDIKLTSLTEFFTTQGLPPTLLRFFAPGRKIPSDLKRSQAMHPFLGTKPSAVVEFGSREAASKALSVIRQRCSTAYIHFLSDGARKTSDENPKKKEKKEKRA
ncbi:Lupus la ribonucleoprotein [Fasciola gigantica]|uniref:Lupus la ribonucleoprotein n=1 Tax=Fasciola gigantica TaxID=46835 RepID=A0A504XAT4_FASGI|nr:Lupus la ribonucleoprotein [Fasciola gigantica]